MAGGRAGRWFLLPGLVFLFAIDLIPLAYSAWISLYNWWLIRPRDIRFVGLANYTRFADDPEFTRAVVVTTFFTASAVLVEFLAGLGLALLFAQPFKFLRPIRVLLLLPLFVVPVVGATMWRVIFHPELGVLNYYLGAVGLSPLPWLSDPRLALVSITLVDAWRTGEVTIEGGERLADALAQGHGVLLWSAHLGNWELAAEALARSGLDVAALARAHEDKDLEHYMDERRRAAGVRIVGRCPLGREARRVLRAHGLLALLGDRRFGVGGRAVPFFGTPARLPAA